MLWDDLDICFCAFSCGLPIRLLNAFLNRYSSSYIGTVVFHWNLICQCNSTEVVHKPLLGLISVILGVYAGVSTVFGHFFPYYYCNLFPNWKILCKCTKRDIFQIYLKIIWKISYKKSNILTLKKMWHTRVNLRNVFRCFVQVSEIWLMFSFFVFR